MPVISALAANEANATPAWCNVEGKEGTQRPNHDVDKVFDKDWSRALL